MANIVVGKKDEIVMKILHYFVTEENYRPIIVNGVQNEIWLENLDNDISLIRININYIHNSEQLEIDMRKCNAIRKTIKKKTYSFKVNMLNLLLDVRDEVKLVEDKNIETIKIEKISDLKKNETINEFFPNFKDKVETKRTGVKGMFEMTEELNQKTSKDDKKLAKIFKNNNYPTLTVSLIIINIIAYFLILINYSEMIGLFGNHYLYVKNGEIWRLITSMFMHANVYHLFCNMYALYVVGSLVEKYYGKLKYFLIYIGSGIMGSLFSVVLSSNFSVGASGAIFGLFGAMLVFGYKYRTILDTFLRSTIIPILIVNLAIGFIIPSIDMFAHIGGLLGGILFSFAVGVENKNSKQEQINGIVSIVVLFALMAYLLIIK